MGHQQKSDFLFLKTKSGSKETLTTCMERNLYTGFFDVPLCSPLLFLWGTMNPEVYRILDLFNKSQFFSTIKNKEGFAEKICKTFHFDICHEIKKADLWLEVNTQKRYKRYDKFLLNWLNFRDRKWTKLIE